jgi:sorbitol-specific phosphotransferase system component IIC
VVFGVLLTWIGIAVGVVALSAILCSLALAWVFDRRTRG